MKLSAVVRNATKELLKVLKECDGTQDYDFCLYMVNFNGDIYTGDWSEPCPKEFSEDYLVYEMLIYTREYDEDEIDVIVECFVEDFINHSAFDRYNINFDDLDSNKNIFDSVNKYLIL